MTTPGENWVTLDTRRAGTRNQENQRQLEPGKRLQGRAAPGEITFVAQLTVPLAGMLDATVLPITEDFGQIPREVLRAFLAELAEGFRIVEG